MLCRKLGPAVVSSLCLPENVIKGAVSVEKVIHLLYVTLVCKLKLVLQIVETIVHWGRGKHQDLGLHSGLYDFVHQFQISILSRIAVVIASGYLAAVAKVMGLVNYYQVVIAPVDMLKVLAVGLSILA